MNRFSYKEYVLTTLHTECILHAILKFYLSLVRSIWGHTIVSSIIIVDRISRATGYKMADAYDYLLKLLLIGEAKTGKSSIKSKFSQEKFDEEYKSTIGESLFAS